MHRENARILHDDGSTFDLDFGLARKWEPTGLNKVDEVYAGLVATCELCR
jgi:hypothetical protein